MQLPFFVYGTLLPGQPNYHLWGQGIAGQQPATFANGRLFDMGYYPMLVEGMGSEVSGMLVTINVAHYADVLQRIDVLEGFNPQEPKQGAYRRLKRVVQVIDKGRAEAWVYLGTDRYAASAPLIESGDWVSHASERLADLTSWWAEQGPSVGNSN